MSALSVLWGDGFQELIKGVRESRNAQTGILSLKQDQQPVGEAIPAVRSLCCPLLPPGK